MRDPTATEPAALGSGPAAELVVLVDEHGAQVGTAPKQSVHHADTPLHRAFSCYAFGPDGRLLLTRRASSKHTFPGLWTNTVCGHPGPGEEDLAAVNRRAGHELGLLVRHVRLVLPDFRYRAESGGIVENEICPVYLATIDQQPHPDPTEVEQVRWSTWGQFLTELAHHPERYSPWCRLQARQLEVDQSVPRYLSLTGGTSP